MVLAGGVENTSRRIQLGSRCQKWAQVQSTALVVLTLSVRLEVLGLANHFFHRSVAKFSHNLTNFLSNKEEIVYNVLWLTSELLSEFFILSSNTHGAGIQMALSHHDATHGDQRGSCKTILFSSKKTGNSDIASSLELTISLQLDAVTESIENKSLLSLSKTKFPRKSTSLDSSPGSCSCTTIVSTDKNVVRIGLGNTCSNNTDTNFRDKLDRNFSIWLGVLQIMNELSKILNRVNVVVRRWGNQTDTGGSVTVASNVLGDLESWKFSSFSRLGSLCHLDLNLVTVCKIFRSDTKTTRGHLLDAGSTVVGESLGVFTTFSSVGTSSELIHGHGQSLVSFLTDRTKRHGSSGESLDNLADRFHFFKRNGLGRIKLELELSTKSDLLVLFVGQSGEFLVGVSRIGSGSNLEVHHTTGSVQVGFATISPVELTITADQDLILLSMAGESIFVESFHITVQCLKVGTLDSGGSTSEAAINNFFGQTNSFKDLSALVTLECGNTHLAHNLEKTLGSSLAVVADDFFIGELALGLGFNHTIGIHLAHGFVGHVRTDTIATISKDCGKVMDFLTVTHFGKNGSLGSLLGTNQVMVDSTDSDQRRQGHAIRSSKLVRENDTLNSLLAMRTLNGPGSLVTDAFESGQHSIDTRVDRESHINHGSLEFWSTSSRRVFIILESSHFFQGQDWMLDDQSLAVRLIRIIQKVTLGSNRTDQTHDNFLTNGINGRVCDLSKELLEVIIDLTWIFRQDGQGSIISHTS
mmetsp:Transcript_15954/g.39104  ORF Transcript_15954/g.39104 Transcript_15954/m.39104 type:complete len:753 (+) Transcript_15954:902-3160(+)